VKIIFQEFVFTILINKFYNLKEIFYLTAPVGSTHLGGGKNSVNNVNGQNGSNSKVSKNNLNQEKKIINNKQSVNAFPNPPIIVNIINNMIFSLAQNKGAEKVKTAGLLDGFNLSLQDAEALILNARIIAGWIDAPSIEEDSDEEDALDQGGASDDDTAFNDQ
jgi:hypothetical protein